MKILVTVGSMYPMDRIITEFDACAKKSPHTFFVQIGNSLLKPKNVSYTKFFNYQELTKKMKWADLIISHAGAGSIIDAIAAQKRLILIPRLKKYGEAIDDHQLEMCQKMKEQFDIPFTVDEKELILLINKKSKAVHLHSTGILAQEIKHLIES